MDQLPVVDEDQFTETEELVAAEYVVFLFAVSAYIKHLSDVSEDVDSDKLCDRGIRFLRDMDRLMGETMVSDISTQLATDTSKAQLRRTFNVRLSKAEQVSRRALSMRTVFNRGSAAVVNNVFDNSKARKWVKAAFTSDLDEPIEALTSLGAFTLANLRLRGWIQKALAAISSASYEKTQEAMAAAPSAVESASSVVADATKSLKESALNSEVTSGTEEAKQSQKKQTEILNKVRDDATAAAQESIYVSGEADTVPTKAEVVGLATAAAVAALSNMDDDSNIPEALRPLDAEQRAAVLTEGRVVVAAGAGAGKSTTLSRRVQYLVQNKKARPDSILVSSFNTKAAAELKYKIGKIIGNDTVNQMTVGTMHSTFKAIAETYGSPEEKMRLTSGFVKGGANVARAVSKFLKQCNGKQDSEGTWVEGDSPPTKAMMMYKTKWAGNNIKPAAAKALAKNSEEILAAEWYELYCGFKGDMGPQWRPVCKRPSPTAMEEFNRFLRTTRVKDGKPVLLGDFDDQINICGDILERNEYARNAVQSKLKHILIDEAQDLNESQLKVLNLMAGAIDEKTGSYWLIGDPDQSIYAFRGARPELFNELDNAPGWKTKTIRTNYRCPPEVVDLANKLVSNNMQRMEKEALPSPSRSTGEASIKVEVPYDEAQSAISIANTIEQYIAEGAAVTDNAALARTNAELNSFETALLMKGIPYARKGNSSFLGSSETKAFMGYITLASSADYEAMQSSLVDIINKPNRLFLKPDTIKASVEKALSSYARRQGTSLKNVNPMESLRDPYFLETLVMELKKGTGAAGSPFIIRKGVETLQSMVEALDELELLITNPDATTDDMFDAVLNMPGISKATGTGGRFVEKKDTFKDQLLAEINDRLDGEDDDEAGDNGPPKGAGLGNISFLYMLADPTTPDPEFDTSKPEGFLGKMKNLESKVSELRIDLDVWDKKQEALPVEDRKPAPGVYLGTVHATKGAQWQNVFVQMPKGRFPMVRRPTENRDESEMTPDAIEALLKKERDDMESERRLAYVALTRPSKNLKILCPTTFNGKAAGVSPFVSEAGLTVGENVQGRASDNAEDAGVVENPSADPNVDFDSIEKTANESYILSEDFDF